MTRTPLLALLLALSSPTEAHCHRYWAYPWRDPGCASNHRKEVMRIAQQPKRIDTRADQRVRPDPPDDDERIPLCAELSSQADTTKHCVRVSPDPPPWAIEELRIALRLKLSGEIK